MLVFIARSVVVQRILRRLQRVADVDKCARLSRWGIRERTKKELALSKRDREYIAATYEPNEYEKKILGDKK